MDPLFFVHVPKTAGTSFRHGAERAFGNDKIVYDYGPEAPQTSALTREYIYGEASDGARLYRECRQQGSSMLAGHVPAAKYAPFSGVASMVTFVREPLQRTASEYSHFQRILNYKGSFREFMSMPLMVNRQASIFRGVDMEAIGVVGLTENYSESLELINARFGIDIQQREDNRGKPKVGELHKVSPEDEKIFRRRNAKDFSLYERCRKMFETRLQLYRDNLPFAHARLSQFDTRQIAGWAWWEGSSERAVEVEVLVNGEHQHTLVADQMMPSKARMNPPRAGYVGFQLPVSLSTEDKVQCRVVETGQMFPPGPRRLVTPS
ncbi:hypothetical protein [Halomonas sp. DN3]|uniref:hypothetical protein n=1 Tax=Halomonas sp. DN3 TaxID=2953657 RepID=UPI00209F4724|nr:hypothetical protein [Halomonas sp. DN3]USZ49661.1 hypothetical protein NKF27_19615 [Halomonas sp. DN3]